MHTKFVKTNKNAFKTLFVANHNTKKYKKYMGFGYRLQQSYQ
jgi:hypothetical protein